MAKKKAAGGKTAKKRPGKGGPRPNSGRKSKHDGGTKQVGVRLPIDVVEWLSDCGMSQAEAITQAVRTSPAFLKSQTEQSAK